MTVVIYGILIFSSILRANPLYCGNIFNESAPQSSSFIDESGFIDLFNSQKAGSVPGAPVGSKVLSLAYLKELGNRGRSHVRKRRWSESDRQEFLRLSQLSFRELSELSIAQQLALFKTFSQWNLLMPQSLSRNLENLWKLDLDQWKPQHFNEWALARKMSPQIFSSTFVKRMKGAIIRNFSKFNPSTQLEVLAAEIMHGTRWSVRDLTEALENVSNSLEAQTNKSLHLKPLKEMYRSLIYLRAIEPGIFFPSIVRLESRIEQHLAEQGLSLSQGGTSGAINPIRPFGPSYYELQRKIDKIFPGEAKVYEAMDPSHVGFFDPVDLYYPGLRLVVEWDGPIHNFRAFDTYGEWLPGRTPLRPLDAIKDQSLRRMGISVLRISPEMNDSIKRIPIVDLIKRQNPQTWDH